MVNIHILGFCKLQVVPFVVRLMKQANVFPPKKTLKKFILWGINNDKGILKEDFQAFGRVPIINKDSGGHTLVTSSTKTRMDLRIGQSNKSLTSFRGLGGTIGQADS